MTDNEPVTLQTESARVKRLEQDLADANKTQEAAIATMEKRKRDAKIDELLELADTVRLAKVKCDAVQASINASQRTIARLEWETKSAKLTATLNPIASQVRNAIVSAKNIMAEFKVTGITVIVTDVDKDNVMVAVKPVGPDVPKPPTKRGSGGKGGGGGRVPLTVDGTEYDSANAALMAAFPDFDGKMGRQAIISKLTTAGHTVS